MGGGRRHLVPPSVPLDFWRKGAPRRTLIGRRISANVCTKAASCRTPPPCSTPPSCRIACPLSHGACRKTRKPRAIATASLVVPRRHAMRPRHGFVPSAIAVSPAPTFARGLPECRLPAACAVGGEAAHGFGGYAGQNQITAPCAPGTKPGRGKSQAIEHNRALHKAGQSLRCASLDGLPLSRPAGSCNGRLCLAPRPGQGLFWLAALRLFIRALRAGWSGNTGTAVPIRRGSLATAPNIKTRGSEGRIVVRNVVTSISLHEAT